LQFNPKKSCLSIRDNERWQGPLFGAALPVGTNAGAYLYNTFEQRARKIVGAAIT